MRSLWCLRCKNSELKLLGRTGLWPRDRIAFFECPACRRHYSKRPGRKLTFRWLHPVSLPLYEVLFETSPIPLAEQIAQRLAAQRPAGQVQRIANEIELELNEPTQAVREILDNPQSEETCRAFLREIVRCLRTAISSA